MDRIGVLNWIQFCVLLAVSIGHVKVQAKICTDAVCKFELDVSFFKTMTYREKTGALRAVFLNDTQLKTIIGGKVQTLTSNDVIAADGFERDILVFNKQLPGPTLEVMEGSLVVVTVNNLMKHKVTSIHWHGMLQKNTYFMDGAESITQCPILPGQSFTYRFWARPQGTHWYHAHVTTMRLDGLFGMLIVHKSPPKIPYFPIIVNDWNHITSDQLDLTFDDYCKKEPTSSPYGLPSRSVSALVFRGCELDSKAFTSSLFDGVNRWQNKPFPLKFYVVNYGERYRFRMVNAGHSFPFQIQIDGHQLTIVASDGMDIEPIIVDSVYISIAESMDFEINADQPPGRYWIRADTQCEGAFSRGIVAYRGFEGITADPVSKPRDCTPDDPCRVFNCPFGKFPEGSNTVCVAMSDARSTLSPRVLAERFGVGSKDKDVIEIFLNFNFVGGPNINGRRFMMPIVPLFQDVTAESNCVGEPCRDYCSCRCTNIQTLPYDRTVRLIISNLTPDPNGTQNLHRFHIFHMHGYQHALLAEKFPTFSTSNGQSISSITELSCGTDALCSKLQWTNGQRPKFRETRNPIIKDTISIPVQGYVVLQFKTDNPGYWIFHCHIDLHMMEGMAGVFKVAPELFPELPAGFPTCDEFTGEYDEDQSPAPYK